LIGASAAVEEIEMKKLVNAIMVAGFATVLALSGGPALAQAQQTPPSNPNPSATAVGYAKEILAAKSVSNIYKDAIPNLVERTKVTLIQANLNYQKDLTDVSLKVAKDFAGRENEIGDEFAKIYAQHFTEPELKELVTFYKSALGKKLIDQEPVVFAGASQYMANWAQKLSEEINGKFRAEMRARGKNI
jgi:hypothetical protein